MLRVGICTLRSCEDNKHWMKTKETARRSKCPMLAPQHTDSQRKESSSISNKAAKGTTTTTTAWTPPSLILAKLVITPCSQVQTESRNTKPGTSQYRAGEGRHAGISQEQEIPFTELDLLETIERSRLASCVDMPSFLCFVIGYSVEVCRMECGTRLRLLNTKQQKDSQCRGDRQSGKC
ncbi:hypothetical protein QR685DRAFT_152901 [Neurospora intermedia]|uniref:Uncharacterized protein n=1 Tax=Neurospora intermedia TaxID=5142 RepID=A0ABR3DJ76_NEUIN